ncbi:competence protein ComL [Vitreoscilla filiformis]|uniref:Outer membrane protein assembly factor BamD n=1 Tax=Vitreoscilla filiformis TaxID=63 RepID=A0A221KHI4_VITFI|nr:outer membrane protein assembly factor BamD [Vitreoscilla filiformis]ASM78514.1 competence protein ComL [Vitreoscilla filiformis]
MIEPMLSGAVRRTLAVCLLALLSACGSLPDDDLKGTAEELYADAKEQMASGNWAAAIRPLERIESRAGGSLLAQQAQLDMAYAQWKNGEKARALTILDRFVKFHPSSVGLDYALYLRGVINFNDDTGLFSKLSGQTMAERDQQASREAYQSFKQLVDQFPESKYAPDARLRMDYIVNMLADYEVNVARYYLRRGAHQAAINRATECLTIYPQTPANEEALFIMVQAYDELGMVALRDDTQRILRQNFPDSEHLKTGVKQRQKRWWQVW